MNYSAIAKRITLVLFSAQALGSAGFIAAATINSNIGADLSGVRAFAGVPSAVYQFGSAFAAYLWGILFDRLGRRGGLALGLCLGVCGAVLAESAVVNRSFLILLLGMPLMGAANSALQLSRFAAAEVHPPSEHSRAISNVVIGGTFGAIVGPLTAGLTGQQATRLGLSEFAGPYAASAVLFAVGAVMIFVLLKPDPREIGKVIALQHPTTGVQSNQARRVREIFRAPAALAALITMVVGQLVMVMLMVITSLHMQDHQHNLTEIGVVISSHTVGMFAFSIFSGRLADRWGRVPVILIGAATLILACLSATISPEVVPLAFALLLLGLGWNFCYVGGSSLLAEQLSPSERARTQGFNDLLIGLVSAFGSVFSSVIFANIGYVAMGYVGALAALVPLGMIAWWKLGQGKMSPTMAQ